MSVEWIIEWGGLTGPFLEACAQENGLIVGDVIKDFFFIFFLLQLVATQGLQQDSSKCKIKDWTSGVQREIQKKKVIKISHICISR